MRSNTNQGGLRYVKFENNKSCQRCKYCGGGTITLNNQPLAVLPIGSIIETTSTISPAQLYGGTWEEFGKGKVLVGCDANDTQFNEVLKTGGEKTHTLIVGEMPSHCHGITSTLGDTDYNGLYPLIKPFYPSSPWQKIDVDNSQSSGNDRPHNNLQPYIVVYRWRRVE